MVRSYTDDQGYCQPVKQAGALAIGEFWTNGPSCGDSALVSTVWDFLKFYTDQFKKIQDGAFKPSQLYWLDPRHPSSSSIGARGSQPTSRTKIQQTLDDLTSGKTNPFVGPIKDTSGVVKIPAGQNSPTPSCTPDGSGTYRESWQVSRTANTVGGSNE